MTSPLQKRGIESNTTPQNSTVRPNPVKGAVDVELEVIALLLGGVRLQTDQRDKAISELSDGQLLLTASLH
jgi:hypothetical protein